MRHNRLALKGSTTVFLSLTVLLVLSLICSLLEAGRYHMMAWESGLISQSAVHSALAGYQKKLWETYGLLGVEIETAQKIMDHILQDEMEQTTSIGNLSVSEQAVLSGEKITDQGGIFLAQQLEKRMILEIADTVWQQKEDNWTAKAEWTNQEVEDQILEQAEQAQEEADELKGKAQEEAGEAVDKETGQVEENPIEIMKQLKKRTIFELVLPQNREVSCQKADESLYAQMGPYSEDKIVTVKQKAALLLYSSNHLSCFVNEMDRDGMVYELEYLIGGKSSDDKNLEAAIEQLLLFRELVRYAEKQTEPETISKAAGVATALVGATGMPPLVMAVQQGILLAWAFQDAIEDVKSMINGEKVNTFNGAAMGYQEHLEILLWMQQSDTLYQRLANLVGNGIGQPLHEFHVSLQVQCQFQGVPLFEKLVIVPHPKLSGYEFTAVKKDSYLP